MSGASRDATLLVTTFYPELIQNISTLPTEEAMIKAMNLREISIKREWQKWRDWIFFQTDMSAEEMSKRIPPF